ncbi:MAG: PAQR family membrane homeostasis protein TrhA [Solirubrobacteraceae bacterium]
MEAGDRGRKAMRDASERVSDAREAMGERREAALERMGERRDAAMESAAESVASAKESAADGMASAKAVASEGLADAREVAAEAIARVKPRLRGVSHEYAFFVSLVLGAGLIVLAKGAEARLAVAIYAVSLSALFGVSALYHRVDWQRPSSRRWMRRLDHTMIFFVIAGTVTPFALLVLEGTFATALLIAVWGGALAGTVVELVWLDSPKWVAASVYVAVGVIGAVGFPAIAIETGPISGALIAAGGVMYLAGAVIYAVQRPDPNPAVFGYHEIFHVLVIAAAATHFAAVAFYAIPAA